MNASGKSTFQESRFACEGNSDREESRHALGAWEDDAGTVACIKRLRIAELSVLD